MKTAGDGSTEAMAGNACSDDANPVKVDILALNRAHWILSDV